MSLPFAGSVRPRLNGLARVFCFMAEVGAVVAQRLRPDVTWANTPIHEKSGIGRRMVLPRIQYHELQIRNRSLDSHVLFVVPRPCPKQNLSSSPEIHYGVFNGR